MEKHRGYHKSHRTCTSQDSIEEHESQKLRRDPSRWKSSTKLKKKLHLVVSIESLMYAHGAILAACPRHFLPYIDKDLVIHGIIDTPHKMLAITANM